MKLPHLKKLICLLCVSSALLLPLGAAEPRRANPPDVRASIDVLEKARQVLLQGTAGGRRMDSGTRKALEACERALQQLRALENSARR